MSIVELTELQRAVSGACGLIAELREENAQLRARLATLIAKSDLHELRCPDCGGEVWVRQHAGGSS